MAVTSPGLTCWSWAFSSGRFFADMLKSRMAVNWLCCLSRYYGAIVAINGNLGDLFRSPRGTGLAAQVRGVTQFRHDRGAWANSRDLALPLAYHAGWGGH
ncbi:MAG: hypothetical protein BroJett014_30600 [Planctomycetota bacterium]|nr:MAG: hypothetical protein BroJett014_30600 [Planctomycetota bacterium]